MVSGLSLKANFFCVAKTLEGCLNAPDKLKIKQMIPVVIQKCIKI